ncbi:MAG: 2'-5' RNA ligase family protein [Planctomycetota bacterium]|nr:2'-5' RNA ligase family protein [Planctomycetota bacterium]
MERTYKMGEKTHTTAVVLILPEDVWGPIQDIRRKYDTQYRRWMPHVTLLYPFRPQAEFDEITGPLQQACRTIEPFDVEMSTFRWFSHGGGRFTFWLAPEPGDRIRRLHEALWEVLPDCDDVRRFADGFTPHLSVGKADNKNVLDELLADLQSDWQSIRFRAGEVALIRRSQPPDDIFRVDITIQLGPTRQRKIFCVSLRRHQK